MAREREREKSVDTSLYAGASIKEPLCRSIYGGASTQGPPMQEPLPGSLYAAASIYEPLCRSLYEGSSMKEPLCRSLYAGVSVEEPLRRGASGDRSLSAEPTKKSNFDPGSGFKGKTWSARIRLGFYEETKVLGGPRSS